jgi:hypothetical protein
LTLSLKRIFLAEFYAYCVEKTCRATARLRFPLLVCAEILLKNLHIILVSTHPKQNGTEQIQAIDQAEQTKETGNERPPS